MRRVTLTGATGLIGTRLVRALRDRGDEVTVLSRSPERAREAFGGDVEAHAWDPGAGPAPAEALAGRDAVVHLAGEDVAQRWTDDAKRRILESRENGTRNLVAGLRLSTVTSSPRASRAPTSAPPTRPVAPVTVTRMQPPVVRSCPRYDAAHDRAHVLTARNSCVSPGA